MQIKLSLAKLSLLDVIMPILIFFLLSRTPSDADMWWHLRAGQDMWQNQQILLVDTFSYTKVGMPWVNAFWLSEIMLYIVYRFAGFFGIACAVSLLGATTFGLIYFRIRDDAPVIGSLIVILAATGASPVWGPRPQIISFFIFAVLDFILSKKKKISPFLMFAVLILFSCWANIHGGWIWGILLLLAHITGDMFTALQQHDFSRSSWQAILSQIGLLGAAILAIGINPNGISIWKLPFHTVEVSMQIQEWLSPDFHQIAFHPFLWLLFLFIISANFSKRSASWAELIKVIGFAYLTFVSQRNIAPFTIVMAPVLSNIAQAAMQELRLSIALQRQPRGRTRFESLFKVIIPIILFSVSVGRLLLLSSNSQVEKDYPSKAVNWLANHQSSGRILNSYNWGGYLAWKLPEVPVYIDGRADLYGNELIAEWHSIVMGSPQGLKSLDKQNVQIIFLEPSWPIVALLPQHGWQEVYRDDIAVIYCR